MLDGGGDGMSYGYSSCKTLRGIEKNGFLSSLLINLYHTLRYSTIIPRE